MAQPALGLQIRQLEQELGVPLLVRHSRGVTPTSAGQLLYERSIEILNYVENARQEVIALGGAERESLILGLTNGTTALLGKDILMDVRKTIPELQLSLVEEMSVLLVDALERDEIDVAIAYDAPEKPGLTRIPLLREEVLFVRSAAEEDETAPLSLAEALRFPLVLPNERDTIRRTVQETADRLALEVRIAFEAQSISMLKQLVAEGGVASIMPYASVLDEVTLGGMRARRIADPKITRVLYLITRLHPPTLAHEIAFFDYLGEAVRRFCDALGPLAEPLPGLDGALSDRLQDPAPARLGAAD